VEALVVMVEKIAEDVNVLVADAGAQFHSGDDFNAEGLTLPDALIYSVGVVVVGDADDGETGLLCPPDQFCRRQDTVGIVSVHVEISSTLHATHAAGKEQKNS
jgi:hypothetical protein